MSEKIGLALAELEDRHEILCEFPPAVSGMTERAKVIIEFKEFSFDSFVKCQKFATIEACCIVDKNSDVYDTITQCKSLNGRVIGVVTVRKFSE